MNTEGDVNKRCPSLSGLGGHGRLDVSNVICASCMLNVHTLAGWREVFARAGVGNIEVTEAALEASGLKEMIADEGLKNAVRIMFRAATDRRIRQRLRKTRKFFAENGEIFGYGIFTAKR